MAPQVLSTDQHFSSDQVLPFKQSLLAVLGLAFVCMLVGMDQTIVGTALPTIVAELNGFELYAWVGTSYLLTSVITVPICGRLSDFYGRKPFVIASVIIFTAASVLCGMSTSMLMLVLARGLQGIGGGMLVGTAFTCIPDLFPNPKVRLKWQIILSTAFGIASAVGPSLGGFLTQYYGWRSVFYVNLPIGIISLVSICLFLPLIKLNHNGKVKLDWLGALLIAASLGFLQLFVELLSSHGFSWQLFILAGLSVLSFVLLLKVEKKAQFPLLPLDMFKDKGLNAIFVLAFISGFSMFVLLFFTPLLIQGGFGLTPNAAGIIVTPLVVCITIGSILSGRIVVRLKNPRRLFYYGFASFAASILGVVFSFHTTPAWLVMIYMVLGGIGLGFVLPNITVFAQQITPRSLLGISTALTQSIRMIGGMLGMAVVGTFVNHFYSSGINQVLPDLDQAVKKALYNPQILVNQHDQAQLVITAGSHQTEVAQWLNVARDSLIHSIHFGMIAAFIVTLLTFFWVSRVPAVNLHGKTVKMPVGE